MDVDAFVAAHRAEWQRLDHLIRRRRRLTGGEIDQLVELYQRVATHLSAVRSGTPDPALIAHLSSLVARGRAAVTGAHTPAWREAARFVVVVFPAAAYRCRRWWLATSAVFLAIATALGAWVAVTPRVQATLGTPPEIRQLVNNRFEDYYSTFPAASFAAEVWTNNVWVAAVSLTFGILLGVPTLYVMWQNALHIATVGGVMVAYGRAEVFFGLIAPHGLLELTAVFLAAGTGLRLGWTAIDPGRRKRSEALAEEGRAAAGIAIGLIVVFLLSGVIEAFVTPSGLPTWARIGIGVVAWSGFLAYVIVLGRRAVRAGQTGDLADRPDRLPVSA